MPISMFTGTVIDQSSLQYAPWRVFATMTTAGVGLDRGPYRPDVWEPNSPQTMITDKNGQKYVFDAILKLDHTSGRKVTDNPVQNGANISDHSYQMPSTLTIDVGMSDSMDSYRLSQWGSNSGLSSPTKSVKAYQQILKWQQSGDPLTIDTRLGTYTNMVVETVSAPDDYTTKHGLKCMVSFKQIIVAEVAEEAPNQAAPQVTGFTDFGNKIGISTF